MKACVTDIQRFSLSDGEGIRTTVFLKGCNMRCTWCHNPETLSQKPELMFYETKCIGCGRCFAACPKAAHKVMNGKHIIDRNVCVSCGKCTETCYAEALVMCGREMSVKDVMQEIRQDIPYYNNSGGGVTISGGEVLCSLEFAAKLAKACRAENIRVAIETNLSFPIKHCMPLLQSLDFVMCDIKIFDESEHKKYTGVPNKIILENIQKLDALEIPFIVRTPLIPGVTDSVENIFRIAEYISQLKNLRRYELLNFNPLGEAKYKGLDRENAFERKRPLGSDKLKGLLRVAQNTGIVVKII